MKWFIVCPWPVIASVETLLSPVFFSKGTLAIASDAIIGWRRKAPIVYNASMAEFNVT